MYVLNSVSLQASKRLPPDCRYSCPCTCFVFSILAHGLSSSFMSSAVLMTWIHEVNLELALICVSEILCCSRSFYAHACWIQYLRLLLWSRNLYWLAYCNFKMPKPRVMNRVLSWSRNMCITSDPLHRKQVVKSLLFKLIWRTSSQQLLIYPSSSSGTSLSFI